MCHYFFRECLIARGDSAIKHSWKNLICSCQLFFFNGWARKSFLITDSIIAVINACIFSGRWSGLSDSYNSALLRVFYFAQQNYRDCNKL